MSKSVKDLISSMQDSNLMSEEETKKWEEEMAKDQKHYEFGEFVVEDPKFRELQELEQISNRNRSKPQKKFNPPLQTSTIAHSSHSFEKTTTTTTTTK